MELLEIIALIIAAVVAYTYWRLTIRQRLQDEKLTELAAQIARLNLVVTGKLASSITSEETGKNIAGSSVPTVKPWGETAKSTAAAATFQKKVSETGEQSDMSAEVQDLDVSPTASNKSATGDVKLASHADDTDDPQSADKDQVAAKVVGQPEAEKPSGGALESLIGGQWAVWVGGIALAFGGIFLVRYSIEAGLVGPEMRLSLAALFGLVLLAVGEFIRRRSDAANAKNSSRAYVPGILTAVGSMVLFAVVYGAYALYGFVSPVTAFALMAAISLATLALALVHGPSLAALGLLASYATPVMVATSSPNYTALFGFLLVVTYSALALARLRKWLWLVLASAVGSLLWALVPISFGQDDVLLSIQLAVYLAGLGIGYSALGALWQFDKIPDDQNAGEEAYEPGGQPASFAALSSLTPALAIVFIALGLTLAFYSDVAGYAPRAIATAAIVIIAMAISAWRQQRVSVLYSIAAAIGLVQFSGWWLRDAIISLPGIFSRSLELSIASDFSASPTAIAISLGFVAVVILIGAAGTRRLVRENRFERGALWWALPLAVVPVGAYSVVWLAQGMPSSLTLALVGIAGVVALAVSSEILLRRAPSLTSQRLFEVLPLSCTVGGGVALSIAVLLYYFNSAVLVVLLTALTLAIAALTVIRPVQALRYGAAAAAAVAIARVVLDPVLGLTPAPTIIFNSILPAYGLPVLMLGFAAWLLAKWGKDAPQRFLEGAAVLFAALLFTLKIRHGMNGGDILAGNYTLSEQAAHTITALVLSGAMMRLDDRSPSIVFRTIMQWLGYLSLVMVIIAHGLLLNPFITNDLIGSGAIFNVLMIAYLVPGIIAAIVHWMARKRRSAAYVTTLEATAWLLLSAFVVLSIRRWFVGEQIGWYANPIEVGEAYSQSIAVLTIVFVVAFAYRWLFASWKSRILSAALSLATGLYLGSNFGAFMPFQPGILVGDGVLFNLLLPGFLVPALLYLAIRQIWKNVDTAASPWRGRILGGLALVSIFAWATLMVRHVWHGSALYEGALFSTETYAYSAVWLALGVGILLLSGWRNARDLRIASAFVIFAAVIKVFLFDMSALEGVLRALSFIGLGVVLIGIGLFYQRLLFRDQRDSKPAQAKLGKPADQ